MAIISKQTFSIDGKDFVRKIRCGSAGLFICALPDCMGDALGTRQIENMKLRELEREWDRKIEEYRAARTETNCVICYQYEANCTIYNEKTEENWDIALDADGVSFAPGIVLAVWAGIYDEQCTTRSNENHQYKYVRNYDREEEVDWPHNLINNERDVMPDLGRKHPNTIPFTEKNAVFFVKLCKAIEQLILSIDSITKTPESLLSMIESGVKMLEVQGKEAK